MKDRTDINNAIIWTPNDIDKYKAMSFALLSIDNPQDLLCSQIV